MMHSYFIPVVYIHKHKSEQKLVKCEMLYNYIVMLGGKVVALPSVGSI